MKSRCNNPNYDLYSYYGGRGITVCDRWYSFDNFFEDMGFRPEGTTLDREDPDGNYCKDNCRWATSKVQSENKRNSLAYDLNGVSKSLNDWAEIVGTTRARLYAQMYKDDKATLESVLRKLGLWDRVIDYQKL